MPDGSYYIRNAGELSDAIKAVGRGGADHDVIRRHCITRAKALNLSSMIPDTWNPDGSLKHAAWASRDFIAHFGVKGMHWGSRKSGKGSSHPVSPDAARATTLKTTVKKHGTSALSNQDLQHLVTRLNLEQQHGRLNPAHVSAGEKFAKELLSIGGNAGKQYAATLAVKGLTKAGEAVIGK
jgi:hypothetical protein